MIAAAPQNSTSAESAFSYGDNTTLHELLEQIEVATGARCTTEESRRFLMSTGSVTRTNAATTGPTRQEIECVRQATFKHRLETGADSASATDLMPTLQRLGYA